MSHRGTRTDSGHNRRIESANNRDIGMGNGSNSSGSSRMSNNNNYRFRNPTTTNDTTTNTTTIQQPDDASHTEQGVEVVNKPQTQQQSRGNNNTITNGSFSQLLPNSSSGEDLQRPSVGTLNPPTEELSRIPYDDHNHNNYVHPSYSNDGSSNTNHWDRRGGASPDTLDISDRVAERMEGSYRMSERSTEFSRHDSMSRPSSQSVVSDMSFGDKPYRSMSMTMTSLVQDSGSILPHLNTSHKSVCSLTHGSKRMAEKRNELLKTGSILYSDPKQVDEEELIFKRWGGRKDYSSQSSNRKVQRKKGVAKLQKKRQKAKMKLEGQEPLRIKEGRKSGFHDLWGLVRQDHLEYDQLVKEDKDREKVASFCEEPFWKIIFHFKGTVLKVIFDDILFWLTLATFVSIRIRFRYDPTSDDLNEVNYENLSDNLVYVGGFLTFFLVFYVDQNHHRYFQLHHDSMALMGAVEDIATLAKAVLPMERARRMVRLMNAAHVATYTGLSSNYSRGNLFDPLEARFALLTDEELYRIGSEIEIESGSKASFEMITWIMCDIRDAQINSFIDTNEAAQMRELLLNFRSTIAKVFVTTTLPIPFFYVHFLSMLTAVYLPLFAVVVAFESGDGGEGSNILVGEIVSCLVVFLQSLFVIGLRILGQQLSDPYGGDLIDLQIARYVNMILNGSNQILASKRLQAPSIETELRLQLQMSSLGQAYEYDTDDEYIVQQ